MKHLLTGVAIAAALAIAAPAWAQAPAPAAAPKAEAPAAAPKAMKPMASKQRHHRMVRHHHMAMRHHGKMMGGGDAMTEQLNREELARIQGGGGPPMPMSGPENAGAGQGGPRASGH